MIRSTGREYHGEPQPLRGNVLLMANRTGKLDRKPSYVVMALMQYGEAAWMIRDTRTSRLVARSLGLHAACTLAHTLNVADLSVATVDYEGPRNGYW
jgi:hypothetical protein